MKRKYMLTAAFLAVTLGSASCGSAYYVDSGAYKNFDVAADAGVEFPAEAFDFGDFAESAPDDLYGKRYDLYAFRGLSRPDLRAYGSTTE